MNELIKTASEGPKLCGRVTMIVTKAGTNEEIFRSVSRNLIMQAGSTGLDLVINWILGNMGIGGTFAAFAGGINYGEIGTGSTTPTLADVASTTPIARTIVSSATDFGQTEAILQFYFPDSSLTNVTYYEFSTWVNGGSGLGTGNIFNHALFGSPYTKSSGQDITVQVAFTVSQ